MSDITRSEAIKTLKEHLSHWERLLQEHICEEQEGINTISALKLAIASLETDEAYQLMEEQPEFCEDCISRNAVMDMIIEYRDSLADTGKKDALERAYGANYVGMKIADMPSVLPKTDKPTIIDWNKCHTSEQLDSITTAQNDLGVDCISRAQTRTEIEMNASRYTIARERGGMGQVEWSDQLIKVSDAVDIIRNLPSVTPQEPKTGHCKDCKWWKDSDGKYRRGVGAESKCPINCNKVYEGNGYCYMFEPQESEEV